jgi:phosphatidylglycerophosphate synthase
MGDAVREHRSLLAASEKRLLIWIAARLPAAIHSDHLTALAMIAMIVAGVGFAIMARDPRAVWVIVGALFLNWFGDSLDGTLARVRRAERPRYGFYVDHVVDIVGVTALIGGLGYSGFMSPLMAAAVLIAYLLVSAEVFLATAVHGTFRMSFAGIGPTELRILLAAGAFALLNAPTVDLGGYGVVRLFDFGGAIAIVGLAVAFLVSVARNARALSHLEPRRLAVALGAREADAANVAAPAPQS